MNYKFVLFFLYIGFSSMAFAVDKETANEYSYLELSVQAFNFDEELAIPTSFGSETYKGALGAGAKLSFQPVAYGFGFVEAGSFYNSGSSSDLTLTFVDAGLGVAYPLSGSLDVIGTLALTVQNAEVCSSGVCVELDADGPVIGGGLRLKLNEHVDILGKYEREDLNIEGPGISGSESYNIVKFEVRAGREQHGFIAGVEVNDGDQTIKAGYRFHF